MRRINRTLSKSAPRKKHERGVALITTLLLLMLLSGLALAMAWSTQSDMLINGYYRNYRGAFYAADSGLNIARQAMVNQFVPVTAGGALPDPSKFVANSQPIPNGTEGNIANAIKNTYGNGKYTAITGSGTGTPANSWPEKFTLTNVNLTMNPAVDCQWTSPTNPGKTQDFCANSLPSAGATFIYTYHYTLVAQGQAKGNENTVINDNGVITVESDTSATSTNKSFAAWGMFIDQYGLCSGGTLVPGTITGPVFTNGSWNFGNGGKYTFTDAVGQAGAQAGYQAGSCVGVAGPAGNGIAPTFNKGFNLSQPTIPLPKNTFNQERAVLDGKGGNTAVTNTDLNSSVKDVKGNAYPNSGSSCGVYLPYNIVGGKPAFTGGGIYVQGNASVTLSPSGTSSQVYTITQPSGTCPTTTTTTVTVTPTPTTIGGVAYPMGATVMTSGGTTQVIAGVPAQYDPSSGAYQGYDTMLYVNGSITSLSGPAQGKPAIQNGTALTITAANNVTITGDVLYTTEPVVTSGSNIDALVPSGNTGQALGIFTATGNIDMRNTQSNGNLEIDASLATISQGGSGGLTNTGNAINTLTIVGGRIQNTIQNINTTTRNVLFDQRFANGFSPPWFPSTTLTPSGINSSPFKQPTVSRLSWQNQTPY